MRKIKTVDTVHKDKMIKLIIANDHKIFREGLRKILSIRREFKIIGEAENGSEVISETLKKKPDIVLMDIEIPPPDGILATKEIKAKNPKIKVIMLSMYEYEHHLIESIRAGASGYMIKSLSADDLIKAIKKVAAGGEYYPDTLTPKIINAFRTAYGPKLKKTTFALTKRETEILKLASRGLSNKEIGKNIYVSEKTIKNHFVSIYQKLDVPNRTAAVVKALKAGILSV